MATGKIEKIKIELDNIDKIRAFYSPNYGEIIGFDIDITGHRFSIYFNKGNKKLDFYEDTVLIWSK